MITLKDALAKAKEKYEVGSVIEYRDFWIFDSAREIETSILAVNKENGEVFVFFPPAYHGKDIGTPKVIDISTI